MVLYYNKDTRQQAEFPFEEAAQIQEVNAAVDAIIDQIADIHQQTDYIASPSKQDTVTAEVRNMFYEHGIVNEAVRTLIEDCLHNDPTAHVQKAMLALLVRSEDVGIAIEICKETQQHHKDQAIKDTAFQVEDLIERTSEAITPSSFRAINAILDEHIATPGIEYFMEKVLLSSATSTLDKTCVFTKIIEAKNQPGVLTRLDTLVRVAADTTAQANTRGRSLSTLCSLARFGSEQTAQRATEGVSLLLLSNQLGSTTVPSQAYSEGIRLLADKKDQGLTDTIPQLNRIATETTVTRALLYAVGKYKEREHLEIIAEHLQSSSKFDFRGAAVDAALDFFPDLHREAKGLTGETRQRYILQYVQNQITRSLASRN